MESQFQYYPSAPPPETFPAQSLIKQYKISSSRIWYAAILPALSLFIEIYAMNYLLGLLVWALCIIMSIGACLLDRKYLNKLGIDTSSLSPVLAIIPPAYMFKRASLLGDRPSAGAVCIITIVYALAFNGFSKAARVTEDDLIGNIKNNYWFSISGFENNNDALRSDELIGDTLDSYSEKQFGDSRLKWDAERKSDHILVTAETDGGNMAVEFSFSFDGYVFGSTEPKSIKLGNKTYKDKDAAEMLERIMNGSAEENAGGKDDQSSDDSSDSE